MRVLSASAISYAHRRRFCDKATERRASSDERRMGDRRQKARKNDRRARHKHSNASNANANNQWISPVFAAHIIGQREEALNNNAHSQKISANAAYDKVINPYLRPLHSRKA